MSVRAMNWAKGLFEKADIPPQERLVLIWLCHHHVDKTGDCFPSVETLSLLSGYRERRVYDAIKNLEFWGLIKRQKRWEGARQASNQYDLFGRLNRANFAASSLHKKAAMMTAPVCSHDDCPPVTDERGYTSQGDQADHRVIPFRRPKTA